MTTQELKQYIDRVLGNNIRCLLPSYWWKRVFNQVADRVDEVEQSTSKLIESKVEEAKMPIVESVDELNALEASVGDIATVGEESTMLVSVGDLQQVDGPSEILEKWDSLTRIVKVEFGEPVTENGRQVIVYLNEKKPYAHDTIFISSSEGGFFCAYGGVGGMREITIEEVNERLKKHDYRFFMGINVDAIDSTFKLHAYSASANAYIKGDSWDKLAKEYIVSSEEKLNTLSVENGTIAKVARELKQINRANCHTVIKFSDIPANWDKFTRVDKVEHIGGNISNSCGINLAHYDGHAYVVLRINFVGHMTYVASVYVDSTLTNEESITKAEVDVKLKEYDFRYIGPTFTMGEPYIDSTFILYEKDISVDAYIKGETWERLAKESDLVGNEGDNVVIIYANEESTRNTNAFNTIIDCYENEKPYVAVVKIDEMLYSANITIQKVNDRYGIMAQCINTAYNKFYGVLLGLSVETGVGLANLLTESELITIDSELSETSENPVQNKVVTEALGILEEHLAVHSKQISSLGLSMATKTDVDNAIANAITTTLNTAV